MLQFTLRRKKSTANTVCFRDYRDRIGKVYIPNELVEELGINREIVVEIAEPSRALPGGKGYTSRFYRCRETLKKIRYDEETDVIKAVYVCKRLAQDEELGDEIVVRILPVTDPAENHKAGAVV
ncbi:MAG: hypothetical protein FH756_17520 [Firmicutes bacterium]|nr:hypothetical protein [Bacillota bacterium]